jgi:hypothetical protein
MSLRAQRGNRTEADPPCIVCDCRARNDIYAVILTFI